MLLFCPPIGASMACTPLLGTFDIQTLKVQLPLPVPPRPRDSRLKSPFDKQRLEKLKSRTSTELASRISYVHQQICIMKEKAEQTCAARECNVGQATARILGHHAITKVAAIEQANAITNLLTGDGGAMSIFRETLEFKKPTMAPEKVYSCQSQAAKAQTCFTPAKSCSD